MCLLLLFYVTNLRPGLTLEMSDIIIPSAFLYFHLIQLTLVFQYQTDWMDRWMPEGMNE